MDNAPVQEEPRDIEAEKAVLGAAFLSKNALADAMEYLEPQDFYRKAHQIIFEKMVQLNDADQPIDPLTMKNVLDQDNQTEILVELLILLNLQQRFRRLLMLSITQKLFMIRRFHDG